ncbi:MAG: alpha/beta hydrolase [Ferruginibacter sp.]
MVKNNFSSGYSDVNGLKMYYEIHGEGKPLVLIHGGGSTIQTSFGNIIPLLAAKRKIIAVELQAHGHTNDRDTPLTFQQDADDVAMLLNNLKISKADFLGFSNGGQTTIEIALRHPSMVNKLIIASAFYKRTAAPAQFWEGFDHVTLDMMPLALQEGFLKVNNSKEALLNSFNRDVERMRSFKGWTDEQMSSIKAPTLVINGNHDVGSAEHAVEMHRIIPNAELLIVPGKHGAYLGAIEMLEDGKWTQPYVADIITTFLDQDNLII